jgi:ATP:ADP antiporter, AAA family
MGALTKMMGRARRTLLTTFADVRPAEFRALAWSFLYFFFLLTAWYILRPMREARGQGLGVANLPWLYLGTFVAMLAAHPLWSALVSRIPRRRLMPFVYHFFAANLVGFYLAFRGSAHWIPQAAFYVWASVFGLMGVAVFWSFMSDVWRPEQARRLFGMVALGGGLGAIFGPLLTATLVNVLSPPQLLLLAAGLLEVVVLCLGQVSRASAAWPAAEATPATPATTTPATPATTADDTAVGGGVLSGLASLVRSPYLAAAAGFSVIAVLSATFNIYLQAHLVSQAGIGDQVALTRLFARLDLAANVLTAITQGLLAAPLLARFGALPPLVLMPLLSVVGFGITAFGPMLLVVSGMLVLRRATAYGLVVPAFGLLFTLVSREDKYKVRTFIDTVLYRASDLLAGWAFAAVLGLGLGLRGAAAIGALLAVPWLIIAVALGRMQRRLLAERREDGPRC